jgi:hypothetical protein
MLKKNIFYKIYLGRVVYLKSMTKLLIGDPEYFTIGEIERNPNKFWINREYQRSESWKVNKRQKLLESIFKNLPIGILFVRKAETNGSYEILDGQQRIETIKKFINGKLTTPDSLPASLRNKKFADLTGKQLDDFRDFKIWYIPVYGVVLKRRWQMYF